MQLPLLALRDSLIKKLENLGRLNWVIEECKILELITYECKDEENAYLSIKGSGILDVRGITVLSFLYKFREIEAKKRDRPPFKIISDRKLLELSQNWQKEKNKLYKMDLNEDGFYSRLYKAFEEGLNSKLKTRPKVDKKIINMIKILSRINQYFKYEKNSKILNKNKEIFICFFLIYFKFM